MSNQVKRKAWERVQANDRYRDAYRKWVGRQFLFHKLTGEFYAWEKVPLTEAGRKYAGDLYNIMVSEALTKDRNCTEAMEEFEALGFLDGEYLEALRARVRAISEGLDAGGRADFMADFAEYLNISMAGLWLKLIDAARPETPFTAGLWPLDPGEDFEEVERVTLLDPESAVSLASMSEDGTRITVEIDIQMPDKYIMERIRAMIDDLRDQHGVKKVGGRGTLKGARRGMVGVSPGLAEKMVAEFEAHGSFARLARDHWDELTRPGDQPLEDFADITESRIYRKIYRHFKP